MVSRLAMMVCLFVLAATPACTRDPSPEPPDRARRAQTDAMPETGKAAKPDTDAPDTPIPPAPESYMGRTIARTMHYTGAPWLTRESREREEGTKLLIETLDVREGDVICDMGCGNGFYTLPLAELAGPEGRVYAVDIQPEMLSLLEERASEAGLANIVPTLGTLVDPKLPEGEVDLILCVDVYHEMSHPEQMLEAMRDSLAPDGRLVLVEFRAEDPKVPIKPLHKMSRAQVLKELTANGFELADEFDGLPWQHMMTFRAED